MNLFGCILVLPTSGNIVAWVICWPPILGNPFPSAGKPGPHVDVRCKDMGASWDYDAF